jgi:thiol-disulfide isomerase/thioredoxin
VTQAVNALLLAEIERGGPVSRDVNEPVGKFALLRDNGSPIDLAAYRGKVLVLDYWATWCAPCLQSLAQMHTLSAKHGNDLVVVAVNSDPEESREDAVRYLAARGYRFELVYDDPSRRSFAPPFIPARIVIDRRGQIRLREMGFSAATAYAFERRLSTLLAEKTP